MDTQNKLQGLFTKKNILIILAVFIIAEVLWAGWVIYNAGKQTVTFKPSQPVQSQPTLIQLQSDKLNVKKGEQFSVSINVLSEKETDGADLIINYDPKLLSVVMEKNSDKPVVLSSLYPDYPVNTLDKTAGKITISGIATSANAIKPDGLFGLIMFKAEAPGMAKISLDFTPGSTVDTNVIEKDTGADVLETVQNIDVTISQ